MTMDYFRSALKIHETLPNNPQLNIDISEPNMQWLWGNALGKNLEA
jgi:hypothetical protein